MSQRSAVGSVLLGLAVLAGGHFPSTRTDYNLHRLPVHARQVKPPQNTHPSQRDNFPDIPEDHWAYEDLSWQSEVFYQIFPISFRDSNGDRIGDFKGIQSKLGFLKNLGITAILLNPVFKSRMYHRYFADDFMTADPHFGTNGDFFHLVRAAHNKGIKVVLDMEVQYVADRHPWYLAAKKDLSSPFAKYLWNDPSMYTQAPLEGYDGQKIRATAVDTSNPDVLKAIERVFDYWTAPNGKLNDGVDGFRIDHMMDDFDFLHNKTNMLKGFWLPIIQSVRKIKPYAFFVGEQADWAYGHDLYTKADVNAVFGIPLRFVLTAPGYPHLKEVVAKTAENAPRGKTQLIFIENHDVERYASVVKSDLRALRLGAVLNLTFKGTPIIYQGQELGMKGIQLHGKSDANDIPQRLAYRWNKRLDAPGTARWYLGHVGNDALRFSQSGDGISVEEESPDPDSLLNFYRRLIDLRWSHDVLKIGDQIELATTAPTLIAFQRKLPGERPILVVLNFSKSRAHFSPPKGRWRTLMGFGSRLGPFGYWVAEGSDG